MAFKNFKIPVILISVLISVHLSEARPSLSGPPESGDYYSGEPQFQIEAPAPLVRPLVLHELTDGASTRVKRGAAYAGGHGDFSGVAKQSTFAALGTYGGYLGHGKGSTAGGYGAGSGRNGFDAAGGITISGALGSYGGYLGHKGPTVISSGGFGNGGLLFGKI